MRLTQDHKPTDPKEKERIKKSGGVITQPSLGQPRVNSKLDMSRSIGDVELKAYGVTCEPDTRHIQVRKKSYGSLKSIVDGADITGFKKSLALQLTNLHGKDNSNLTRTIVTR